VRCTVPTSGLSLARTASLMPAALSASIAAGRSLNHLRSDSESASDQLDHSASLARSTSSPRAAASLWLQTMNVTVWQELHFRSLIHAVPTFSRYGRLRTTAARISATVTGGAAAVTRAP